MNGVLAVGLLSLLVLAPVEDLMAQDEAVVEQDGARAGRPEHHYKMRS